MKRFVKTLLFSAGIAVVGLIVYSLRKDAAEPIIAQGVGAKPPAPTLSKEYVEHRRQQIKDAAEARRVIQRETVAASQEKEMPQDGEPLHEPSAKTEESSTPLAEQNASPDESAPLEQAEE